MNQGEEELDWLHDCYFAAVAGDAPAFEAWPSQEGVYSDIASVHDEREGDDKS